MQGDRIAAVGPAAEVKAPADAVTVDLPGATLIPGLMDLHSHLFLHPYDETPWDDQVIKEPLSFRTAAAVAHSRATLMSGFTALRDLGTEGAGDADVGLKRAIDLGVVPGPAPVDIHPRHRRAGRLRSDPSQLFRRRRRPAAGGAGMLRRDGLHSGRTPAGGGRGGLDQALRRLPRRPARRDRTDLQPG